MLDADGTKAAARKGYTALIHFHGIGSQRRHEEVCTLVDSVDKYVHSNFLTDKRFGRLVDIKPRIEPSRVRNEEHEFHIFTKLLGRDRRLDADADESEEAAAERLGRAVEEARFFEVYWAPIMAGEKSPWRIIKWLFARVLRPWEIKRSPWRERQRLRRATLARMFEMPDGTPSGTQPDDYQKMVQFYDSFENLEAQRIHSEGSFKDFCNYLKQRLNARPETQIRFIALAESWFNADRRKENFNLFVLVTAAWALVLAAFGVVYLVAIVLGLLVQTKTGIGWIDAILITQKSDWQSALAVAISAASMLGVGKLISDYLGDIEAWATFDETDELHEKRKKTLARATDMVTHVLNDPDCERVVMTSHSLGTTIAHDTALALWRQNRSTNPSNPIAGPVPLEKIEHFITFGSPIDKIEYFFESYRSASHRYKRVMEALRGDLDQPPFSKNRDPHAHWINFWDQGDPVSGPLHSPLSRTGRPQRVDNVHVANRLFPAPGASHRGYFKNGLVVRTVFEAVYGRQHSYQTLALHERKEGKKTVKYRDYETRHLGPGATRASTKIWLVIALALPWSLTPALAVNLVEYGSWMAFVLPASLASALACGYLFSTTHGQLDPL